MYSKVFIVLVVLCVCSAVANASIFDFIKTFLGGNDVQDISGKVGTEKDPSIEVHNAISDDEEEEEMRYPVLSDEEFNVLMSTSMTALEKGDTSIAMKDLMTVLESDPHAFQPNLLIGTTLLNQLRRPDLAESFLYRAVTTSKWKDLIGISSLALALLQNKDPELSIRVCMEGLRQNSNDEEGAVITYAAQDVLGQLLGLNYYTLQDYTRASEWYFSAAIAGGRRIALEKTEVANQ
jgi:hypothetical protein